MKVLTLFLAVILLLGAVLAGCRGNVPQDVNGHIEPTVDSTGSTLMTEMTMPTKPVALAETDSTKLLQNIWDRYSEEERFSVYGGAMEQAVMDAPGPLDLSMQEELSTRYLLTEDLARQVEEGASLVHLMNGNILTAVALRVHGDQQAFAKTWRSNIRGNRWICGQPDRMILVQPEEGCLLMVFGSQDIVRTFRSRLMEVYPKTKVLYEEAIVA